MATQTIGKYQLVKKLATGGMAEVWLAKQTGIEGFNRHVVIKRILPHLAEDPEFVQMFKSEAMIASRFNHPNIAQIYDLGETAGTYYIAMEFVHGEDLGRIMRKAWSTGQWVARPLAIRIVADACQGLHYAHTRTDDQGRPLRVVHRDISPQNILISFDGSVKLVDFGIAKAADQVSMTKSGAIKGKFAYMAPEQAAGKPLDGRTDVFALGLVLYELLTGVRPLKRESELATLQAALECAIDPPSVVAEVPSELDHVVMRALTKSADDRYKDARAFQMALEEFLVQQSTVATSVQVSELMETLFADRRAEEKRLGAPNPSTDSSTSNPLASSYTEPHTDKPTPPQPPPVEREVEPPEPLPPEPPRPVGPATTQDEDEPDEPGAAGDEDDEDDEPTEGPDDVEEPAAASGGFQLPAGVALPSRRYVKGDATALARTGSRTDNQAALARSGEEPSRPSRVSRRSTPTSAPNETSDDLEPAPSPPRRRSASGAIRRRTSSGAAMPEAPPRRSRPAIPVEKPRASDGSISKYVDVQGIRARNAARIRLVAIAVAVVVVAAMLVLFKDNVARFLNARALDSGVPVLLTVTSNPRTRVRVIPPRTTRAREIVDLGDTPLDRVSGAMVGDTIELTNADRGIRYEEPIEFGQPNEHKLIEKVFREATLKVRVKPPLRGATVWRGNQKVGQVGLPMKVFEGTQKLEVRADALQQPVEFEVRLNPNAVLEHEVDVSASIEKPGQP